MKKKTVSDFRKMFGSDREIKERVTKFRDRLSELKDQACNQAMRSVDAALQNARVHHRIATLVAEAGMPAVGDLEGMKRTLEHYDREPMLTAAAVTMRGALALVAIEAEDGRWIATVYRGVRGEPAAPLGPLRLELATLFDVLDLLQRFDEWNKGASDA